MLRARKVVKGFHGVHPISVVLQVVEVLRQRLRIAADINNLIDTITDDLVQRIVLNADTRRIYDDDVRFVIDGIQNFETVTGNETAVVQSVQLSSLASHFNGFFDD